VLYGWFTSSFGVATIVVAGVFVMYLVELVCLSRNHGEIMFGINRFAKGSDIHFFK